MVAGSAPRCWPSNVGWASGAIAPWGGAEPRMTTNFRFFAWPFSDGRPILRHTRPAPTARYVVHWKQAAPTIDWCMGNPSTILKYSAILQGRYAIGGGATARHRWLFDGDLICGDDAEDHQTDGSAASFARLSILTNHRPAGRKAPCGLSATQPQPGGNCDLLPVHRVRTGREDDYDPGIIRSQKKIRPQGIDLGLHPESVILDDSKLRLNLITWVVI